VVFNTKDKRHYFFLLSFACLPWSLDRAGQGPKESNKENSSVSDGLIAPPYHLWNPETRLIWSKKLSYLELKGKLELNYYRGIDGNGQARASIFNMFFYLASNVRSREAEGRVG